jgi:hypothetical protein
MNDSKSITLSYADFLHTIDKHFDQNEKYNSEEEKLFQRYVNFQKIYGEYVQPDMLLISTALNFCRQLLPASV